MSLLTIILVLAVVGLALWAVDKYVPMDPAVKTLLRVVVILMLVVWLARVTGLWAWIAQFKF